MYFLKNILTEKECKILTERFDYEKINKKSEDSPVVEKAFGFVPSFYFNKYINKLRPIILEILKEKHKEIVPTNVYIREYKNGSILHKHIDRNGLNIGLSICLYNDTVIDWPLQAVIDGETISYNTEVGDGVLMIDSDKISHWRNELNCDPDKRILQFFLHWKPNDIPNKKNLKTLI